MAATVTLDDRALDGLLARRDLTAHLPSLLAASARAAPAPRARRCGGCRRPAARAGIDYNRLRQAVASMPAAEKISLKRLLGAGQIVVIRRDVRGQKVRIVF